MVWQDFSVELLRLSRTIGLCVAPATNRQVDGVFLGTADSTEEHVATTSARYAPVSLRNTSSREVNILRSALNMWSDPHLRMLTPRLGCPHRNKRRSVPGQLVNSYPIYPQAAVHNSVDGGLQKTAGKKLRSISVAARHAIPVTPVAVAVEHHRHRRPLVAVAHL